MEEKLVHLATIAAWVFKLDFFKELHVVEEIQDDLSAFGICDADGVIEIRVRNLKDGGFLSAKTILDTLAHELAHVQHFCHDSHHRRLKTAIKVWLERHWV